MGTLTTLPLRDPVALIGQLDPELIRRRLSEIASERQALLILLRAALAATRSDRKVVASAR